MECCPQGGELGGGPREAAVISLPSFQNVEEKARSAGALLGRTLETGSARRLWLPSVAVTGRANVALFRRFTKCFEAEVATPYVPCGDTVGLSLPWAD